MTDVENASRAASASAPNITGGDRGRNSRGTGVPHGVDRWTTYVDNIEEEE